jgi:TetR/AcrR family transcriptional regulator, regulator of autoinduction and epiphytic fitness
MQPMATKKSTAPAKRRYSSQLRARNARQTREQVLAAAAELFEESGWAGTTVAAIAKRAGVAVETVYSGFGSKKHVLRAVLDFAVVGDADPVPLVEREMFATLATGDRGERITAGLEMLIDIHERVAKLWRTAMEAAASDAEIDGWRAAWDEGRRTDTRRSLELILRREIDEVVLDVFWGIFSHEVYAMLVLDRGLDRAQYAERMRTVMAALAPE